MKTIGFVGAGNMARALGGGIAKRKGREAVVLRAIDPAPEAVAAFVEATGGEGCANANELLAVSEVVILAVKPQVLPAVLRELRPSVQTRHLIISIVAGATLSGMSRGLGEEARVVRAMPNTPALVQQGMTVLVGGRHATAEDLQLSEELFAAVGRAVVAEDEALLDAVTAVSGSGPGFVFAYAEAMLAAAQHVGLPNELAEALVRQTVLGSAVLWNDSTEGVDELRRRVTSPGGTTQAGLASLEDNGFEEIIRGAIEAATRRSKELSAG